MTAIIELVNLGYTYKGGQRPLFEHVNLSVERGTFTGIVGRSGIGKTTLIKIIGGILQSGASGEVLLHGRPYSDYRRHELNRHIGIVFQDPDTQILFTHVEDELAFGMENYGLTKEEMEKRIDRILGLLGIQELRDRNPNHLSGGEKQLVVLAAVLCLDVDVVILDECMAQVDQRGKTLILEALGKLKAEGKTVIMIEHEYQNLKWADQIFDLERGSLLEEAGS